MTRYADPTRCPDCAGPLAPTDPACRSCALPLRGETAQQLYVALATADGLLTALRATAQAPTLAPAPVPGRSSVPAPARPLGPDPRPGPSRLSAAAIPRILLALGTACLLVAAAVFLAVAWSALGVGGRTAVLVGLTAVTGLLAGGAARRGLRVAAEAMACVGLGLLTLDLVGARSSGWWGDLSDAGLTVLAGSALLVAGLSGARAAAATRIHRLVSAELVVAAGVALVTVGLAAGSLPAAPALVLGVVGASALAGAARRLGLPVAAAGTATVALLAWLALALVGLDRVVEHRTWRALWLDLEAWPVLVAAGLAAAAAAARRLPRATRVAGLGLAQLLLASAVLVPTTRWDATAQTLVAIGVLLVAGVVAWRTSTPWGWVQAPTQLVSGAAVAVVGAGLTALAVHRLGGTAAVVWGGRSADRLPAAVTQLQGWSLPVGWLVPLCVLALIGTAWSLAGERRGSLRWLPVCAPATGGGLVAAVGLVAAPIALVVALLLALGTGAVVVWAGRDRLEHRDGLDQRSRLLVAAVAALAAAGVVSLHAELLSAVAATTVVGLAILVHLRSRGVVNALVAGAVVTPVAAACTWSWAAVLDVPAPWAATVGLLVLGGLVLVAAYARRLSPPRDHGLVRVGLETAAGLSAIVLGLAGDWPAQQPTVWVAVHLSVAGVVVTLLSRLQADRRGLGGLGIALLTAATWVRLLDLGVVAPEAYTLPLALVLLAVGLRTVRDRSVTTTYALGPGLGLALLPSLLWVWADPGGPRPLLLGLACLLLVTTGVRVGWTAPLVTGAAVGAALVLRLAAPYVDDALPRWVLMGAAGALLVTLGATWERRLSQARTARHYVRGLR